MSRMARPNLQEIRVILSQKVDSGEVREKAVAYVVEQNKSIAAAARELGVGESTLGSWITAVIRRRGKIRSGETYDNADLFEGDKAAEEDLGRRDNPGIL